MAASRRRRTGELWQHSGLRNAKRFPVALQWPVDSTDCTWPWTSAVDGEPGAQAQRRPPMLPCHQADRRAWERALRPKPCRLALHRELRWRVAQKLALQWSPEQISG